MRNIEEIINTIENWEGTYTELVNEFSVEEYRILFEEGCFEYFDTEWIEESCHNSDNYADMLLTNFISDWLMSNICNGYSGKATNNLFRMWNECC